MKSAATEMLSSCVIYEAPNGVATPQVAHCSLPNAKGVPFRGEHGTEPSKQHHLRIVCSSQTKILKGMAQCCYLLNPTGAVFTYQTLTLCSV